jgi:hypothetical protein
VIRHKAVKDLHSHPGDAFSYGVCELLSLSGRGLIDAYVYKDPEDMDYQQVVNAGSGRSPVTGY